MKQEIDTEMKKKLLGIFSDENMKKGKKEGRERMREEDQGMNKEDGEKEMKEVRRDRE